MLLTFPCPHADAGDAVRQQIRDFIGAAEFPCVGAKSALNRDRLRFGHYATLGDPSDANALRHDLGGFSSAFPDEEAQPASFIATFEDTPPVDEVEFESLLWLQLQLMHDLDRDEHPWNSRVSADPAASNFSMSIGGRAYFVVGLHPQASRLARRAPMACLVFNFHDQFEALKRSGKYASMQTAIRTRDTALQGSINPVLARFGESSEARQYSGRAVNEDWVCPFHSRSKHED